MTNPKKKTVETLEAWTSLKEKLITTLTDLRTRVNPELLNLEKQILTKHKELKTKQEQIKQLKVNIPREEKVIDGPVSPPTPQERELDNLKQQERQISTQLSSLQERLTEIYPLIYDSLKDKIGWLETENKKLYYLYSLETSLNARALENQQYENRLRQEEEKRNKLREKLEKIRSLVIAENFTKLKTLLRQGQI